MLENLKVLNGKMSLKFDPMNSIYTVSVNETVEKLDLEYHLKGNNKISIIGNENLKYGKNEIVITVYNENEMESYYLYVYKENTDEVMNNIKNYQNLEIQKEEIWEYAVPVISVSCFLIILLLFTFLFKRKKRK